MKRLDATHFTYQYSSTPNFKAIDKTTHIGGLLIISAIDTIEDNFKDFETIHLIAIFKIKYK